MGKPARCSHRRGQAIDHREMVGSTWFRIECLKCGLEDPWESIIYEL